MALNNIDFWIRLNELIKSSGYTQDSLSLKCGFSKRRIQNLSQAKRLPDVFETYLIATELNTTVEYLVSGKHPQPKTDPFEKFQEDLSNLLANYKK